MQGRTALVIGGTGLVGKQLVQLLLTDDRFSEVILFVRRLSQQIHPKLRQELINFNEPDSWKEKVKGDVLFSCLGTTLKTAGSKEAQYLVDYTYQYNFAAAAAANGVPVFVLVSSAMADPSSRIFYTRIKGELEREVTKLGFPCLQILRPGMLQGDRKENRPGEKAGIAVVSFLNKLGIAKSQKPIADRIVAKAMINASFQTARPVTITSLLEVFKLAGEQF